MVSRRITGGFKTFVDDGLHESRLSKEDSEKIDVAYIRARKRQSTWYYKLRKFLTGKLD